MISSLLIASLSLAQAAPAKGAAPTLTIASTRKVQGMHAVSVAASPTGARLAVGVEGGKIKIVDALTGATIKELVGHPQDAKALDWSPNGAMLASGDESARIFIWDTKTWTKKEYRPHTKAVQSLAFNKSSTLLASTGADDTVKVWNLKDLKKPVLDFKGNGANLYGAQFVGTTNDFACATLTDSAFVVSPRGDVKKKLTIMNNLTGSNDITVNAAASRAVTAGRDNAAAVFDLKTGFRLAYLRGHLDWVAHVLFSPDGKWCATSSSDGTVRIYDMKSSKTVESIPQQSGVGSQLAFTGDGKYLVTIDAFDNLEISKLNMSVAGGKVAMDVPVTTTKKTTKTVKRRSTKTARKGG